MVIGAPILAGDLMRRLFSDVLQYLPIVSIGVATVAAVPMCMACQSREHTADVEALEARLKLPPGAWRYDRSQLQTAYMHLAWIRVGHKQIDPTQTSRYYGFAGEK